MAPSPPARQPRPSPGHPTHVTGFEETARRITADLRSMGGRHALIGGFAVSVRTEPRFTQDVDLVVAVDDDAAAEAIVRRLLDLGYDVLATVEHEVTHRLATVRLALPESGQIADLLFASSGIEAEIVDQAEILEVLPGLDLAVATTGHLIALKLLARDETRPQDDVDLRALAAVAQPHDLHAAREAVAQIERRGYHRGRALGHDLDALLAV